VIDRRRFLVSTVRVVATATALAPSSASLATPQTAAKTSTYAPTFFSSVGWRFVIGAIGRLIPSAGEGPGGVETGVPE